MTIYKYGIDVSQWQKGLNLANYKDKFVIIRAGYGCHVDKCMRDFATQCTLYGIPFGFYWYSYAVNAEQAREEAQQFLNTVRNFNFNMGLWLDMEDADNFKRKRGLLTQSAITNLTISFMTELEKGGHYCGIYSSESWFRSYIKDCDKWDKWVASWGPNNGRLNRTTSNLGNIQQFTSKPIDQDVIFVPLETFSKKSKSNNVSRETPTKKSDFDIAREVLRGEWGNGQDRKNRIESAGYNYKNVQHNVNLLVKAQQVISGKYGNGVTRKRLLERDGYNYKEVQSIVNKLVK